MSIIIININIIITILSILIDISSCVQHEFYTNQFAVHLKQGYGDDTAHEIAKRHGFKNLGKIGNLDDHYLFESHGLDKTSSEYSHYHHSKLSQNEEVVWTQQQQGKIRKKRDNINTDYRYSSSMPDPLFSEMWYLNKGARGGYDMNVKEVWAIGYTGKGVVVTILDDGIQPNHPDLSSNYDPQASYDLNDNDPDPTPQDNGDNKHGTRCAGEVAAQAYNEFCGTGIAFNASIGGVRMLDGTVTDEVEARALSMNPQHIHIYSASWGPEDDGRSLDGPGRLAQRAFIDGIKKGRNGLGSVFVWASGNGGRRLDNCNCDGYTNSIYTLSISSATQNGAKPWYLEECSSTLATTYSSGTPGRDQNVITVDQDNTYFASIARGEEPNASKLCTSYHTGTSASAPIAAAVVALALEANPSLTWRDLQYIVIMSSKYEPLRHESGWVTNGVGRRVNHKFGYGMIDALTMVRYAEQWIPLPMQKICETRVNDESSEIPKELRTPLEVSMLVDACHDAHNEVNFLEHVQAKITLKFAPRGSLRITLTSPSGTTSNLLLPRPRDSEDSAFNNWPFLSTHYWGENPIGNWKLVIQNEGSRQARIPGKLISWSLVFMGTKERPEMYNSNGTTHYLPRRTYQNNVHLSECAKSGLFQKHDSNDCVKSCPDGQWADYQTGSCQKCSPDCDHCFGPTSDACLSCKKSYFFYGYHCVKSCPDNFYTDVKLQECLPCSSNCWACAGSPYNCTKCRPFLSLNKQNHCASPCQSEDNSTCIQCSPLCATCNGRESSQCTSCHAPKLLLNGQCIEGKCPPVYFEKFNPDRNSMECSQCHYTCLQCNGASHKNCSACYVNASLTEEGMCVSCLDGQFMNTETKTCSMCHSSCLSCTGPTSTDCTKCDSPLFLDGTRCVPCCKGEDNEVDNDVTKGDCCDCANINGPCKSSTTMDMTRSIPLSIDGQNLFISNKLADKAQIFKLFMNEPQYLIATVCFAAVFLFAIVFVSLQFKSSKSLSSHHKYSRISSNNDVFDKNMERIKLTSSNINDEEDCLYEKPLVS